MVNGEKLKVMTEIALDESVRYKDEIAESGYYRTDYIFSHVTSTIWNLSIAYFLSYILVLLYQVDDLMVHIAKLPYHTLIVLPLSIYGVLVIITAVVAAHFYAGKYQENQMILEEYNKKLEILQQFYTESGEEKENDTAVGI